MANAKHIRPLDIYLSPASDATIEVADPTVADGALYALPYHIQWGASARGNEKLSICVRGGYYEDTFPVYLPPRGLPVTLGILPGNSVLLLEFVCTGNDEIPDHFTLHSKVHNQHLRWNE